MYLELCTRPTRSNIVRSRHPCVYHLPGRQVHRESASTLVKTTLFHYKMMFFHYKMMFFHYKMTLFHYKMMFFHWKMMLFSVGKVMIFLLRSGDVYVSKQELDSVRFLWAGYVHRILGCVVWQMMIRHGKWWFSLDKRWFSLDKRWFSLDKRWFLHQIGSISFLNCSSHTNQSCALGVGWV